ncbi:MAG: FAD:protein FMN transferase [bacterium]|nr:FAD:protein FMN transferase [bacterium]
MERQSTVTGPQGTLPGTHRFRHLAMGTTFEIFAAIADGRYAEHAAYAAFEELDRIERQLSRYIENSDISRISSLPADQALRVGLDTFQCLELSCDLWVETHGAFDVTVGSLLDCFREHSSPSSETLRSIGERMGMNLVELDPSEHSVRLRRSPIRIDLGGIGKGYAVDRMAAMLCEWSIETALVHAGHSSVVALAPPRRTKGWPIVLKSERGAGGTLVRFDLQNSSVSGSGLRKGKHIVDPRTGRYVEERQAAWCRGPNAAVTDALSTAFMVMSPEEIEKYCVRHPDIAAITVVTQAKDGTQTEQVLRFGDWEGATS